MPTLLHSRRRALAACLVAVLFAHADVSRAPASVVLQQIAGGQVPGFARPIYATAPTGDASRLFFVEQHTGQIRIMNLLDHSIEPQPFLTLGDLSSGNEQGALGLAFHPDYQNNGLFFVSYTDSTGRSNIVRYNVSGDDPDRADPTSAQTVLRIGQPQANHNGGWIGFNHALAPGQPQYLYIASGDGGGGNDNATGHTTGTGNAQDITRNLLGKMLRIDVDGDEFPDDLFRNYAIPPDNPFVGSAGDDEIWAYGLRNPWRSGFDRATNDFYIADVGQNNREEVNFQPGDSPGGENYGWRLREGTIATPTPPQAPVGGDRPAGNVDPIHDYQHLGGGRSVTGGYVYRGPIEEIQGRYFFADFISSQIWSLVVEGGAATQVTELTSALDPPGPTAVVNPSSFAEDDAGNLYLLTLGGSVFKFVLLGDMDGDGKLNAFDVNLFELALADREGYVAARPGMDPDVSGDLSRDGMLDATDVSLFEAALALAGAGVPIPEPGTLSSLALGGLLAHRRRRGTSRV